MSSSTFRPRRKLAFLVGNKDYPGSAALRWPVQDAEDLERKLMDLGFTVTIHRNLTKGDMGSMMLRWVATDIREGDLVFIYFSGHGMEHGGQNYLIPIDAVDEFDSVRLNDVLEQLNRRGTFNIVMLDCCRDNDDDLTFKNNVTGGRARGVSGLSAMSLQAPQATQSCIGYACAPGTVAGEPGDEGSHENGFFTHALLQYLDQGKEVVEMTRLVRNSTLRLTDGAQTPWFNLILSDRVFLGRDPTPGKYMIINRNTYPLDTWSNVGGPSVGEPVRLCGQVNDPNAHRAYYGNQVFEIEVCGTKRWRIAHAGGRFYLEGPREREHGAEVCFANMSETEQQLWEFYPVLDRPNSFRIKNVGVDSWLDSTAAPSHGVSVILSTTENQRDAPHWNENQVWELRQIDA
mmetsp:Transcript_17090/g.53383  ORF Transcript_17090/g.53383 Transcript_17090/m.53383 type:complete len:403 (-) Transcript_17090:104-1312(-)|eukprot:CAMPEP_0197387440 /NCGR_PEP_ID=MMETSP1165-20131217/522_1 /TAXON_ID=284809 /ORGANISM="Chrysocystis fragilis, Strain CCMP3189" /LENGTH=402 /DNA_ID=CAMNT_0042912763 /DNA_START=161 /DNA_END=1369 /DNA_ORIENTATION=+